MKIAQFCNQQPTLLLEKYFQDKTWAWGIFTDRFGNLKRSFQVIIDGSMDNNQLLLDEQFLYDNGETQNRIWQITLLGNGHYRGTADDIVGQAEGQAVGNALNWQYHMLLPIQNRVWKVHFNDWFFLQSEQVLINKARVSKWGITLGEVSLFFSKQAPSLCKLSG
jgi:hypothetical protein